MRFLCFYTTVSKLVIKKMTFTLFNNLPLPQFDRLLHQVRLLQCWHQPNWRHQQNCPKTFPALLCGALSAHCSQRVRLVWLVCSSVLFFCIFLILHPASAKHNMLKSKSAKVGKIVAFEVAIFEVLAWVKREMVYIKYIMCGLWKQILDITYVWPSAVTT